jgi:NAD(P)-dependent dehydrogenase (short-subunit alcohol dehydrogenase family)
MPTSWLSYEFQVKIRAIEADLVPNRPLRWIGVAERVIKHDLGLRRGGLEPALERPSRVSDRLAGTRDVNLWVFQFTMENQEKSFNSDTGENQDPSRLTRRSVIGGATTGLIAVAAPLALVQESFGQGTNLTVPAVGLVNPAEIYPHPPFPHQVQPWPGLASKMDPRPDHGEKSYRGAGRLQGRRALITGGDSGLGRATAIAYAREGASVAINHLPQEEPDAKEVVDLLRSENRKIVQIPGDIREEQFCDKLVSQAVQELGGLDIVVNVAGRQHAVDSIENLTTELFDWTMKTNTYAMFWITKAAIPHLQPGSTIINTASEQAYNPREDLLDYASTKGAIVTFSKCLAKQLAPKGIRVNAIAPGPFWTPLQPSGGASPDKVEKFGQETPFKRPGQPVELAPLYVFLASNESTFASGQVMGEQGGLGVT